VFITDEVKDIVPEFLTLLHGVIDSPDIPLNVSRSYLQSDSNVKKINSYITKKVAEKLASLFKDDRKSFEEKWEHIGLFVKYGVVSDQKFYDRAKNFTLIGDLDDKKHTIEEYEELIKDNQTDKDGNKVIIYTTDPGKQDTFIEGVKAKGYSVAKMDGMLDNHFISSLEQKLEKVQVKRVDSDIPEKLVDKGEEVESVLSKEEQEKIVEIFKKALNDDKLAPTVEGLPANQLPVTITKPEFMRRMEEMAEMQGLAGMGFGGQMPGSQNITINGNHELIGKILKTDDDAQQQTLVRHAYDLALLSQDLLKGSELTAFIKRSAEMI
jgi:molecular chaperone HtpG